MPHIHLGVLEVVKFALYLGIVNILVRLLALHLRGTRIGQVLGFAY